MSKRFLYSLLSGLIVLAGLVLWILAEYNVIVMPEKITFDFGIFILVELIGFGALNLLSGILRRNQLQLYLSGVLLVGAWIYVALQLFPETPKWYIIVIVSVALMVAMYVIGIFFKGGVSATTADNAKIGYKNYEQRQKAKERQQEKDEKEYNKAVKKGEIEEPKIKSFKD